MTLVWLGLAVAGVGLVVMVVAGSRGRDNTATLTPLDFIGMGLVVGGGAVVGVGGILIT